MTMISKDDTISKFPGYHSSEEEEPIGQSRALNKYGFIDHLELQRNEFASHRQLQQKGNMNGWLIYDEDEPLEHEASDKEVDSDLESTASSKPMMKKTTKPIMTARIAIVPTVTTIPAFCIIHVMVNTRTDAEFFAAIQNALHTLLPQIHAEIREEFRTSSGPSDASENP
nr:hypothetical protein [Tanacetum cinerariifolium]